MEAHRVYFIGLGGSGMLPLARLAHLKGYVVAGSDPGLTPDRLAELGAWGMEARINPDPDFACGFDTVVYSSAIAPDHPERIVVANRAVHRMDFLVRLASSYKIQLAVAGTHGKTGTTSLLGWCCIKLGLNPAILVGGQPLYLQDGVCAGDGSLFIYETDESDASFLKSQAGYRLLLNIDRDHMDTYGTLERLTEAFHQFAAAATVVSYNGNDAMLDQYGPVSGQKAVRYCMLAETPGLQLQLAARKEGVRTVSAVARFDELFLDGQLLDRPGVLLAGNALGGLLLLEEMIESEKLLASLPATELRIRLLEAIASFPGVARRLEFIGQLSGHPVYDDYGHHPTEVVAVIQALRKKTRSKIAVVFQPHRYTRTRDLFQEFAQALNQADYCFLLPIYPSGEAPLPGIVSQLIVELMDPDRCGGLLEPEDLPGLAGRLPFSTGCAILSLGAGSVSSLMRAIIARQTNE